MLHYLKSVPNSYLFVFPENMVKKSVDKDISKLQYVTSDIWLMTSMVRIKGFCENSNYPY